MTVPEVSKKLGVTEQKKLVSEPSLDNAILMEAAQGYF